MAAVITLAIMLILMGGQLSTVGAGIIGGILLVGYVVLKIADGSGV